MENGGIYIGDFDENGVKTGLGKSFFVRKCTAYIYITLSKVCCKILNQRNFENVNRCVESMYINEIWPKVRISTDLIRSYGDI